MGCGGGVRVAPVGQGRDHMKHAIAAIATALLIGSAGTASAQSNQSPFIHVLPLAKDGNVAWWLKSQIVRPMDTAVSGVSVDRLNAKRGDSAPNRWCFVAALRNDAFTSADRATQVEMDTYLSNRQVANFAVSGAFTGGEMLDAVVGNSESCDGSVGAFILITDRASTPNIVHLDEWDNWKGLIWLQHEDDALVVGSCFDCGHAESLFYDPRRTRFYWENSGD